MEPLWSRMCDMYGNGKYILWHGWVYLACPWHWAGAHHVWRAAAKQQAVAAGKMKERLEKSVQEDVFLSADFAFLPLMLGTREKVKYQCQSSSRFLRRKH